ncbi:4'-phosphopantetheinyl transferase superfamily protein [Halalkalibacter sp. APA_J-10(15)]|uniref:4'-phosphopantetheinyl transferase family protein n=1 Tax=Halalkalibacter sp. APA_J-10(15) TaxID=2933805 RepID=UPI001FF5C8DB|nr:4'-phosphopantetheinyl transferase superfamily protein [Halalkalibacter sp. APA_J-10(15)]MCK0471193.1 4'-phosphopantetheinyl transferase superfamily protein [Halalkalibacter sp. APA_J-10(15)]
MEIYALKLNNALSDSLFAQLLTLTSSTKRNRINRFVNKSHAEVTLMADVLLRFLLARKLNIALEDIHFQYNHYGKPLLRDRENIHFNISHSGNWIVCGIDDVPIGVDIEQVRQIDEGIAKRFFSTTEYVWLQSKAEADRVRYFYLIWTMKESILKNIGIGLSMATDSFSIELKEGQYHSTLDQNLQFKQFNIDPTYVTSVCSKNKMFPPYAQIVKLDELLQKVIR